jgi:squalene-hopene/tetraprenyl-beta-curcumene cyclase
MTRTARSSTLIPVADVLAEAAKTLFAAQRPDGSWQDYLPSAAVSTATSAVALHYADPERCAPMIHGALAWLRRTQLENGGWGDGPGERPTLPATAFAVAALNLLEPDESEPHVERGLDWIETQGGMAAVADPKRCALHVLCLQFLALSGLYDERRIKRMPAGVALLPRKLRQKVSFVVPVTLSWSMMQLHTWPLSRPVRAIHRASVTRTMAYFDELRRSEGPAGGTQESPLLVSMMCFAFARAGLRPDLVERMVGYLRTTYREDGSWAINRDLEFSVTTFVAAGLQRSGYGGDARLAATQDWIRGLQLHEPFPATGCGPGGWAWSQDSGWPNSDDTADGLIALHGFGADRQDAAIRSGVDWLLAMQNRGGSWSCFCKDNHVALDAPCAVITSHAVLALHEAAGMTAQDKPIRRAVQWYASEQKPDGSIPNRWYRGLTAGTAATLEVLGDLGLADGSTARGCRSWLVRHQNEDGGWGDGIAAASSAEETAWALSGLLAAGADPSGPEVQGAVRWLIDNRLPNGLWRPTLLGVYFLDLWYHDDLLAAGYVLQALGRYQQRRSEIDG